MSRRRSSFALCAVLSSLIVNAQAETGIPVSVVEASSQPVLREVDVTGTVTSPQVAALSPAIAGLVAELKVEEGDTVSTGRPLLVLDQDLVRHQLAAARAQLKDAEISLKDARRRLKEAESLGPKGGLAETVIEDIRTEVARGEATVARSKATVAEQQVLLDRHTLKAPFTGIVSRRLVDLGEWVAPGQGILELVATENLRLDFAMAEDFINLLPPDSPVSFRINAMPEQRFTGKVGAIVPVADPGARTFLVRILPDAAIANLRPGLSAVATVRTAADHDALVVPEDAILRYPDGRIVAWIVDSKTTARERVIKVGEIFNGMIPVLQGLSEGDRVVVRGNETLHDGQQVKVIPLREGR